ncbi:MAG: hypothetical protein ABH845_04875, partial [Candidatus Omnitrophota bacterium]
MTAAAAEKRPVSFSAAWKKVKSRILPLICASFLMTVLLSLITGREQAFFKAAFDFVGSGILYKMLKYLIGITPYLNFFIAIALQTLTIFIVPYLVLENKGFFRAVGKGFVLGGRYFVRVFLLLLLPMVCYSPIWLFKGNPIILVRRTGSPETVLWILGVSILATLLVDTYIAVSATLFFLQAKEK